MAQYKDGDTKTIGGVTYTRQGGVWAGASQQPNVIVPAQPKPKDLQPVPGHPNLVFDPTSGNVIPLPGVTPPPAPTPSFIPNKPGFVVGGTPDKPEAVPISGLPQDGIDPEKRKAIEALQQQLDRVNSLWQQKIQGGLPNPIMGHLPTSDNSGFESAAAGLVGPYQSAFRVPGVGTQSDTELKQFEQGGVPSPTDTDAAIKEKITNLQTRINTELGITPSAGLPPIQGPQGDGIGLAGAQTRVEVDPVLKAVAGKVGKMLSNGTPRTQIEDFLRKSGVDPASTDLDARVKYRVTPEFKRWQRANPGAPYPIDPSFYTKQIPMSDTRAIMNQVSQSAPGAFAAASANAISGGRLNNMMSNPELAQTGMDLLRGQHGTASFLGDLAGQASVEASLGRIPGAQSLMATRWGRRGADALYGAYSGSGENDGDPLSGALTGAATNAGFGMFGRGAQKGLGRAMTGVKDAQVGYLHDAGVPLTIGRIGRGSENEFGKMIGGLEERAMGLPGLDAVIGGARQRGDQAFNNVAFNQIAPNVSATGVEGLAQAKAAEKAVYNRLKPMRVSVDAPFEAGLAATEAAGSALPRHSADIADVVKDVRSQINAGEISGQGFQSALQTIRKAKASLGTDVMGHKAAQVLDGLESEAMALAQRSGGSIGADLAEANAIHARRKIIQTAEKASTTQRAGEIFSPLSLNQSSIRNTEKFGGLDKALSPDRPFFDLTRAGIDVMPNATPDSGTAGRMLLVPALAGLGGAGVGAVTGDNKTEGSLDGLGYGALAAAALSAPYSKGGQKMLQKMLVGQRPELLDQLGKLFIRHPKYAGMFGSAMGRDYVYQPEIR